MSWDFSGQSESGVKAGDYEVSVAQAEVKPSKSGGEYIKVRFDSTDGQRFYHNFNVKNDNPKAVQIGMGQLKKLLRVSGKADPTKLGDCSELLGLRAIAVVKIKSSEEYGEQAEIKDFKAPKPVSAF